MNGDNRFKQAKYGGKTAMPGVAVRCPTDADVREFNDIRRSAGFSVFDESALVGISERYNSEDCCMYPQSHPGWDLSRDVSSDCEIITLAEFKLRIGALQPESAREEPERNADEVVHETHIYTVGGVDYDVIRNTIDGATLEKYQAQRDRINSKLATFAGFKGWTDSESAVAL